MSQRRWGPPQQRPVQRRSPYGQSPYGQNPYGWPGGQRGFTPAPYGRPGRPAPRRRNPFAALLRTGITVGLLMLAGTVVSNLAAGSGSDSGSDTAYQNDQYQVPPPDDTPPALPQPETYSEAEQLLTDNPIYDQTTPAPVRCEARPVDVGSARDRALQTHFTELMECLVRVWQPPVEAARWQLVRPTVTIYGREITTRCGKSEVNAFYCGADQQIYYSNRLDEAVPVVARERWAADVVMAHEFAHALQARTAILISSSALGQQSEDKSTELAFSRRLETQADCFSGMSLRSISEALQIESSDIRGILDVYNAVGDDTLSGDRNIVGNHGLGRSREYWGETGLNTGDVGACNTFTAESDLVR